SKAEKNLYSIEIPKLGSLILTHEIDGEVKGLKAWKAEDRPPVAPLFYCFRLMVGIGVLMLLTGICAFILNLRKKLFSTRWFQIWCMLMTPSGFAAILFGWMVTEMGRQPYVVYGMLRTQEVVSNILGVEVLISLSSFVVVYALIFGAGTYYILKL